MAIKIYYDGDCPFCSKYVKLLRLRETFGAVELVDLRVETNRKSELENKGFDLDQGMVVDTGDKLLAGADAVNFLSASSTPNNAFNRINQWMLGTKLGATILYPILRSARWLTLFILGRPSFHDIDEGILARATIFSIFFSLFSIFHVFNLSLEYGRFPPSLDQYAILISALLLFFKPSSMRLLFLLALTSTISTLAQFPIASNHMITRSALLLGYWIAFMIVMCRGKKWTDVFLYFSTAGQGTLLVMYFFGVFHKINEGFLTPETSCAVALWHQMPPPLVWLDFTALHYAAIYGTLILESLFVLMLLVPKWRHYGVIGGILFHLLLSLSNYSMYISFTTLSITLHSLFLSNEAALRIVNSPEMHAIRKRVFSPVYMLIGILFIALAIYFAAASHYTFTTVLLWPILLPYCFLVLKYGHSHQSLLIGASRKIPIAIGSVVTVLFFANCFVPYLGLKSAQSINMFANLRLEAGPGNHLIMRNFNRPFNYLDQVVEFTAAENAPSISRYIDLGYSMVYYQFLTHMEKYPDAVVSYKYSGQVFENVKATDLKSEIDANLHGKWFRKWFHFQPVVLDNNEHCNV